MMKKLLTLLIIALLMLASYFVGTMAGSRTVEAPPAEWTQGNETAQAWRELVVSLEAAGAEIFNITTDERERGEGLAYLAQLASASLELKLAKGGAKEPAFTDWMSDYRKFIGDSPDAIYDSAVIAPEYVYEITGNMGEASYLGVMIYGVGLNDWNSAETNLSNEDLGVDGDGNFTLILSREEPSVEGVWMPLSDSSHMVMVRQYYHDRADKQEAHFTINNLSEPEFVEKAEQERTQDFRDATAFFNASFAGGNALINMLAQAPNSTDVPKSINADFVGIYYPTLDNQYYGFWYQLAEDEALVIEGDAPNVDYWSVSLQNRWMQSMDFQHYQTSLNNKNIVTENGRYKILLSHQNPGTDNWLSTAGYREGLVSVRYQLAEEQAGPTVKLVKLSEL